MKIFQTKSIPVKVKDISSKDRIVKGYFSSFNTIDADGDMFVKGAFAKSISETGPGTTHERIKHLYNHWDAAGKLIELKEDDTGLYFISKLGRHTLGEDILKMYQDEIISEHSIGFKTITEQAENEINIIKEAQLWEGSSLDKWGANMNTPALKSLEKAEYMQKRLIKLEKALRDGTYSDEMFEQLEIQLKQIRQWLAETTQAEKSPEPEATEFDINKLINKY